MSTWRYTNWGEHGCNLLLVIRPSGKPRSLRVPIGHTKTFEAQASDLLEVYRHPEPGMHGPRIWREPVQMLCSPVAKEAVDVGG